MKRSFKNIAGFGGGYRVKNQYTTKSNAKTRMNELPYSRFGVKESLVIPKTFRPKSGTP